VTRELKLALIVGVMLVLGVAVLVSDHLAAQRRPEVITDIPQTPALTPAPRTQPSGNSAQPTRYQLPTALAVQEEPQPLVQEPAPVASDPLVLITQVTPRVSGTLVPLGDSDHTDLINEATNRGWSYDTGRLRPPPPAMQLSQTGQTPGIGLTGPRLGTSNPIPPSPTTQPAPRTSTQTPPALVHTVVAGDSAYRLAQRYLGDGRLWSRIVEANPKAFGPNGSVQIGARLNIPGASAPAQATSTQAARSQTARTTQPAQAARPQPPRATQATTVKTANYVVKRGDTLGGIAQRELGTAKRAGEILELNRSIIKNPDNLPAGATLRLPVG
jgi:LysM repeat protein